MEPKAKGEFLKKLSINGFSITEGENILTLSPRGAETTAEIIIEEKEPNVWVVTGAKGNYAGFYRAPKRTYFESYINGWATEAILAVTG